MPAFVVTSEPLDDAARSRRVFAGDILVFRRLPALVELCRHADAVLREAFGGLAPPSAHEHLPPHDYEARRRALRAAFGRDTEAQRLLDAALEQAGADPRHCYRDRLTLRAQPPAGAGGDAETLPAHRDTWGSNVMAQINWWTPLYPLARERTLALYPRQFARAVANDSAGWDLEELRRRRHEGGGAGYPRLPVATEAAEPADELRVEIEPGDLLCFSGAHLHASVPNTTGLARFNVETRTVDLDDVRAGRGAPNVDGRAPRVATDWFRRLADGAPLTDALGRGG